MQQRSTSILIILDGFGYSKNSQYNAINNANTPQWDKWWKNYPHMLIDASGHAVGLPDMQMGNSEVGHMHIGAGRTILQNYTFINKSIENGDFYKNQILLQAIKQCKKSNSSFHVMGLLSNGGVHSHQEHLFAFLKMCSQHNLHNVYLHLFLDGRDTPPQSAIQSIEKLYTILSKYKVGTISSISGRYFAMDRDQRWARTQQIYDLLVNGKSEFSYKSAKDALTDFYARNIYDEFIPPTTINNVKTIENGDSVFFFNFRADRARQITNALISQDFSAFQRQKILTKLNFISMTEYAKNLPTKIVFPQSPPQNTLGEIIAKHNLTQLRIAETEKYAHVTFFLNGGREINFAREDRILIPSPNVATYDLKPEMSANKITDKIIEVINANLYDIIICNYANADMVGHTGNYKATVKAIETIDSALKKIGDTLLPKNGQMLITADHGNAECMYDEKIKQPHTAHTSELVPLLYVGNKKIKFKNIKASLCDIAPTFLQLLNIEPPKEMMGNVLFDSLEN